MGNSATSSYRAFANWSNISDGRFKKGVRENVSGLDFIMKLRPVTYYLDVDALNARLRVEESVGANAAMKTAYLQKAQTLFSGFVAQEVERAAKETGYDFSGVDKPQNENDYYGLRYAEFVVPLVKAMQEQQQIIDLLQKQVEAAKAGIPIEIRKQQDFMEIQNIRIEKLEKQNELLLKRLEALENKK
jgi:trimeric autotransporter adhesin